jgi:type II secretory pathway component GspD/PulD (secretin)
VYAPHDVNLTTNVVNQAYSGIELVVTPKITDDDMFVLSAGKDLNEVKGKMYRNIRMQQEDKDKSKGTYEMIVDVRYDIQAADWLALTASPGA